MISASSFIMSKLSYEQAFFEEIVVRYGNLTIHRPKCMPSICELRYIIWETNEVFSTAQCNQTITTSTPVLFLADRYLSYRKTKNVSEK